MEPSAFLKADVGRCDLVSGLGLPEMRRTAHVICLEDAVISGIDEASDIFSVLECDCEPLAEDGDRVRAGTRVLSVSGPAAKILTCERTALGFLSVMSGIATAVSAAAEAGKGKIRIAAAGPSMPGFGRFEAKAVKAGGGDPFIGSLDSAVFLRRGHISACGGIKNAMERLSKASVAVKKAAEVAGAEEAAAAAEMGADIIIACGLGPEGTADVFDAAKSVSDRIIVGASGGISAGNVEDYIGKADIALLDRIQRIKGPVGFSLEL